MREDFEQINYHNTMDGKHREAIGVILKVPKKYAHYLKKISVTFVDKTFRD